jgi:hypothetical protein
MKEIVEIPILMDYDAFCHYCNQEEMYLDYLGESECDNYYNIVCKILAKEYAKEFLCEAQRLKFIKSYKIKKVVQNECGYVQWTHYVVAQVECLKNFDIDKIAHEIIGKDIKHYSDYDYWEYACENHSAPYPSDKLIAKYSRNREAK